MLFARTCKLAYMSVTAAKRVPMSEIAVRIVEARERAGFDKTAPFARAVDAMLKRWGYKGISRSAVAQWEKGDTRNLRPENLIAVAEVTRRTAKWIAIGERDRSDTRYRKGDDKVVHLGVAEKEAPRSLLSTEALEIARKWSALSPETRELIARFIESQKPNTRK